MKHWFSVKNRIDCRIECMPLYTVKMEISWFDLFAVLRPGKVHLMVWRLPWQAKSCTSSFWNEGWRSPIASSAVWKKVKTYPWHKTVIAVLIFWWKFKCLLMWIGKGEEQRAAASLACLLCIQLGSGIESEEVFKTLKPIFKTILNDGTANIQSRQAVSGYFLFGYWSRCRFFLFFFLHCPVFTVCNKSGSLYISSRRWHRGKCWISHYSF